MTKGADGNSIAGSQKLIAELLATHGTAVLITPDGNVRVLRSERAAALNVEEAENAAHYLRSIKYPQPAGISKGIVRKNGS